MNPLQYISRTYNSLISDINNDSNLVDKPEFFKRMIAGLGDILSMWNNVSANQSFLRTAFTRQAVKDLLELINYQLTVQTRSSGTCSFYLSESTSYPFSITKEELTGLSQGTVVISSKVFETESGETIVSAPTGTFTANAGDDQLTVTNDFVYTGVKVRFSTTNTLPDPLTVDTDYYLIYIDSTHVKVALNLNDAIDGNAIDLIDVGAGVHTWLQHSFSKVMYQQKFIESQIIGTSDGVTEFQIFDLPDKNVLPSTISITIGALTYTKVDTLVDSSSIDRHFEFHVKDEGCSCLMFGDGEYGVLPPSNDISVTYSVGGGSNSNISTLNKINNYTGGNSDITAIANVTAFTGGADEESLALAKILAPLLLKSQNRFITTGDGETLALNYGGLSYVKINRNTYGVLSCQVIAIASGGGNPSAPLRASIQAYLINLTVLESIDVRFEEATLTTVTVTSAAKILTGYAWADVSPYFTLAWKMFFSETGKEIIDKYNYNGINEAITLINTIFTTSFTYNVDGEAIRKIIMGLEHVGYREFGIDIQESDAVSFIQSSIDGIDYITITLPVYPIALIDNEITTHTGSTFNLTEI